MSLAAAAPKRGSGLAKRRAAAAERMRLSRERKRAGLRCLSLEVHSREIEALVRRGLLEAGSESDDDAVADAMYRFFEANLV